MSKKLNALKEPGLPGRLKVITRPTPELIPHSEFHTGRWLHSLKKKGWYYFFEKQNPNLIRNQHFTETLDHQLRDLVFFLHSKKIKTTPSCAGHYLPRHLLEDIFFVLAQERLDITSNGLIMKDVENGEKYLFKDKTYQLPWNKNNFVEKLQLYQRKGVLGIRLGNRLKARQRMLELNLKGVEIKERDHITFIFTEADDEKTNLITWKQITKEVKMVLG